MKIHLLLGLMLALSACSKKEGSAPKTLSGGEDVVLFEALTVKSNLVDGVNIFPPSSLDFATIASGQTATQELIIQNGVVPSLSIGPSDIIATDIAPFTMVSNCSGSAMARNRSCKLTFSLKNNPSPEEIVLTKSLTVKGVETILTATLAATPPPSTAPVASIVVAPTQIDFGEMKAGVAKEMAVVVTNRADAKTIAAPVVTNPKITVSSNTCTSSLLRNRSCTIKFKYLPVEDETQASIQFTSIENHELSYSVVVATPTASEPEVLTVTPATTSSEASLVEPTSKSLSLSFTNTGGVALPSPVTAVASHEGVVINSVSCSGGLLRNRSCTVAYTLNPSLLPGGESVQTIRLQSGTLASLSHSISLSVTKSAVACTLADAILNEVVVANSNSSIQGTRTESDFSACLLSSTACNPYYGRNASGKSCDVKACGELNAAELTSLEYNLANAVISGTYPACSVSCSSELQELAGNLKSCVDKTPAGSISFMEDFTKELSNNTLNITATNAQKIQFYSDASCTASVGSAISLPLTSTMINLSAGDGEKHAYAKLLNGAASSECLVDSLILDQSGPVLAFTSHVTGASFEGKNLVVNGTCADNYTSSLMVVNLNLGSVSSSANCTGGVFSSTLDTASLSEGAYTLTAQSMDELGNASSAQISLTKTVPLYNDVFIEPAYSKMYIFGQKDEPNHDGSELMLIDSDYTVSFQRDLLDFGYGYINRSVSTTIPSMKLLADGNIYVTSGSYSTGSVANNFSNRKVAFKINPNSSRASVFAGPSYQDNSLHYSASSGKYLYRNDTDKMIKLQDSEGVVLDLMTTDSVLYATEFNNKTYFTVVDNSVSPTMTYLKVLHPNGSITTAAQTNISTSVAAQETFTVFKNKLYILMNNAGWKFHLVNEATGTFDLVPHDTNAFSAFSGVAYTSGNPVVVGSGSNSLLLFGCSGTPRIPVTTPVQGSQTELCIYDGVNPFGVINLNTLSATASSIPTSLYVHNGLVVFRMTPTTVANVQQGVELGVYNPGNYTDIYNANKITVKDLTVAGSLSSSPGAFSSAVVNGVSSLVFVASDGVSTYDFYSWNGLFPIVPARLNVPGVTSSYASANKSSYLINNNDLYYSYTNTGSNYEFAKCSLASCSLTSNGKAYDIASGTNGAMSAPGARQFILKDNYVYFQSAVAAHGSVYPMKVLKVYVNDPLATPVVANEANSSEGPGSSNGWLNHLDGDLLFPMKTMGPSAIINYRDLYRYSPSSENLENLTNLTSEIQSFSLESISYNNKIYFQGNLGDGKGSELLATDGNGLPANLDIFTGPNSSSPLNYKILNLKRPGSGETRSVLMFTATDATGMGLFMIDEDNAPVKLVTGSTPASLVSYKGKVYFYIFTSTSGYELWSTDGTAGGTQMVADVNPGTASFLTNTTVLTPFTSEQGGYQLCMSGNTPATGWELFCYDGEVFTPYEIAPGAVSGAYIGGMFAFKDKLYYNGSSNGGAVNRGLYSFNGVTSTLVGLLDGSFIYQTPMVFESKVFYSCPRAPQGTYLDYELCVVNADGSAQRLDLWPGTTTDFFSGETTINSARVRDMFKFKDRLFLRFTNTPEGSSSSNTIPGSTMQYIDSTDPLNEPKILKTDDGKNIIQFGEETRKAYVP